MNRRGAVKGIFGLAILGGASGVLYDLFKPRQAVPIHLLPQKKLLIAEIAELIIPRTDTPGAKDAKVEDYIIKMITENTEEKARKSFLTGLRSLEDYTYETYNKLFINCHRNEKIEILKHFESKASYPFEILNKVNKKILGQPFFYQFRDLTVEGYCTSFLGATKGMDYDYIPVRFEACIPLKKNQKAWATK